MDKMVAMSIPSFDYAGLSYIVREFDRKHALLPDPDVQKGRAVVMHDLQRHLLNNGLPLEIVHRIFHYHLKNTKSVGEFILCYRGSPAISPLPLSYYRNDAAEKVLRRLKLQGDAFPHLMAHVLTHYFNTLSVDNKIAFIRVSQITVWENQTLKEKIQLLGRARMTSIGDSLRLISWKVQYAVIRILENRLLVLLPLAFAAVFFLPPMVILISTWFRWGQTVFIEKLGAIWLRAVTYTAAILAGSLALSLITLVLGWLARTSYFSQSTKDKGAWVQAVSFCCVRIEFHLLRFLSAVFLGKGISDDNYIERARNACAELTQLLSQSINDANLSLSQETFVNAYRPDLNKQWLTIANQ
ncbi:MAG TPA: hypothetical protein VFU89_01540 [Rhabdochlamydiaceae bacterium]|nr:hypothetical protein [Rhabdochlamydiaceae bacterium]